MQSWNSRKGHKAKTRGHIIPAAVASTLHSLQGGVVYYTQLVTKMIGLGDTVQRLVSAGTLQVITSPASSEQSHDCAIATAHMKTMNKLDLAA